MTHHMDRRTLRKIERMPDHVLDEYHATITTELERALAKRQRLVRDLQCTPIGVPQGPKERRLARLNRQIEILEQIIDYVDRT